jgi:P4 family phage/plasmid primase-like protien
VKYIKHGYAPIPIPAGRKGPNLSNWQHLRMQPEDVPKYFDNGQNVGLLLGEPSGGLIDVDLDTPEAVAAGRYLLPSTLRSGRESSPGSHYWYRCEPASLPETAKFQVPRGGAGEGAEMFVELRSTGKQTVVAPSVHPDGDRYAWGEGETATISGPELVERVREVATAALLARHWPTRGRHELTLAAAGYLGRRLAPERVEAIIEAAAGVAGDEEWRDRSRAVRDTLEGLRAGRQVTGGPTLDQLAPGVPEILSRWWSWRTDAGVNIKVGQESFNNTDLGNASRLIAHHGEDLRYCYPWGSWLIWDGRRWSLDESGEIHRRAKRTVREIYREAADAADDETRKALGKHAKASEAENRIQSMISLAKSEVPIMPAAMDANPWLLNVSNGTVDLRTGELLEHRRDDLITKLAGKYGPEASASTWTATLERVLPSAEVRAFFKRLCGYAISGDVSEHVLPVLYGTGANGKSTILNALLEAAGEYGMQAAPDLLISKRGGHPTEVADLFGMRVVASIEVEDGRRLAEALVKSLTGGDKVRARRMRQDFWQFDPTHTAFLCTNHKPEIRGNDAGIWRRIRLIPFTETIAPAEQDKKLPTKLRSELPGILAWAVEGCLEWQREGLQAPDEVRKATAGYRSEMDVVGAFLRDECEIGESGAEGYKATLKDVYSRYEEWCEEGGEKPETRRKFNARLTERGQFRDRRSGPGGLREWHGLKLLTKRNAAFAGKLTERPQNDYNGLVSSSRSSNSTKHVSTSVRQSEGPENEPPASEWEGTF